MFLIITLRASLTEDVDKEFLYNYSGMNVESSILYPQMW